MNDAERALLAILSILALWDRILEGFYLARRALFCLTGRCPACDGRGHYPIPDDPGIAPCPSCGGDGRWHR